MTSLRTHILAAGAAGLLGLGIASQVSAVSAAPTIVRIPSPSAAAPEPAGIQTAVFAGGCFWGVQGVFQHVKGVTAAVSGYTGGGRGTARYEDVGSGRTGHAEAVRISYDPRQVSYATLLRIFFSVVHDPTELNRQGPDDGPQYRSAIFPTNEAQRRTAAAYIAQLDQAKAWRRPIATRIEAMRGFYPAEAYHQDYLTLHPEAAYIRINDLPKVAALKTAFPQLYRPEPVLVRAKG